MSRQGAGDFPQAPWIAAAAYRAIVTRIGGELKNRYEPPPGLSPQLTRLVVQLELDADPSVMEDA